MSPNVDARKIDLLSAASKNPTIITGLLNPGSLSLNGLEVFKGKDHFEGVLLNEQALAIQSVSGLKTFYQSTAADQLDLQWFDSFGNKIPILNVVYPALKQLTYEDGELQFGFNEVVQRAQFKGQTIDVKNPKFKVDHLRSLINEPLALELFSSQGTSQIYNIQLQPVRSKLLRNTYWTLHSGDAVYYGANNNPNSYGVGVRVMKENKESLEYNALFSKHDSVMGAGTDFENAVQQQSVQMKMRFGYDPFDTIQGTINLKRLTLGGFIDAIYYDRTADRETCIEKLCAKTVQRGYLQTGFFWKYEPLQYKNYGLFVTMDFPLLRTDSFLYGRSDQHFLGFSYRF